MEWLEGNLAIISGVAVPLLIGVVKPLIERRAGGRELRRIRRHAYIRSLLPDESDAALKLDSLLAAEVDAFVKRASGRVGRRVDPVNLVAIIIVSSIGGGVSFLLATLAQAVSGILAGVIWLIFSLWMLWVLLLVFIGGGRGFYKTEEDDS